MSDLRVKSLNESETVGLESAVLRSAVYYFTTQQSISSLYYCLCNVCLCICHITALLYSQQVQILQSAAVLSCLS